MESEDAPMTLFDPIWPNDDSTCVQMKKKSINKTSKCGVPQWSVLELLFFILCTNDIVNAVNANNIRLHADDTDVLCITKIYTCII